MKDGFYICLDTLERRNVSLFNDTELFVFMQDT